MSFSKPPERIKHLVCYRCGAQNKTVKHCGNMDWCEKCRGELKRMSTDPNEIRYIPDEDKPSEKVFVNNVDMVEVQHINKTTKRNGGT